MPEGFRWNEALKTWQCTKCGSTDVKVIRASQYERLRFDVDQKLIRFDVDQKLICRKCGNKDII
jgi:predicted nucleic-acid-binding Zn-ribbon protein